MTTDLQVGLKPVVPSSRETAVKIMRVVRGMMKSMGRLRREFVSPVPKNIPGGSVMTLSSDLPNRKGEMVGGVRVWVYVPNDRLLSIRIRVEWTRNVFGFWYRNEFRMMNDPEYIVELMGKFKMAMYWVRMTADGGVRVSSMNRLDFRKIKKNRVKDRAVSVGMVMG